MAIKYFMFSREQFNMKKKIANKINQEYTPGSIYIGNNSKQFTDIIDDPSRAKFSDSVVVASGEPATMRYKNGSDY